jgi:hypothetical protein
MRITERERERENMKVKRKQVEENLRRGIPVSYGQMTLIVCKSKVSNKAVSFQSMRHVWHLTELMIFVLFIWCFSSRV